MSPSTADNPTPLAYKRKDAFRPPLGATQAQQNVFQANSATLRQPRHTDTWRNAQAQVTPRAHRMDIRCYFEWKFRQRKRQPFGLP